MIFMDRRFLLQKEMYSLANDEIAIKRKDHDQFVEIEAFAMKYAEVLFWFNYIVLLKSE